MSRKTRPDRTFSSCIACAFRKRKTCADASTQTIPAISETDHLFQTETIPVPIMKTGTGDIWYDIASIAKVCPTLTEDIEDVRVCPDGEKWWCPGKHTKALLAELLQASHTSPFFFRWLTTDRCFGIAGQEDTKARRTRSILHIFQFMPNS